MFRKSKTPSYALKQTPPRESDWEAYTDWLLGWLEKQPHLGDKWYLLKRQWLDNLTRWFEYDKEEPGPIDISGIVGPDNDMLGDVKRHDVTQVPKPLWEHIVERFTIKDNLPPIERQTFCTGKEYVVERKLLPAEIIHYKDPSTFERVQHKISRADRVCEIEAKLKKLFGYHRNDLSRLYHLWCEEKDAWEFLLYKNEVLDNIYDYMEETPKVFKFEILSPDGIWPLEEKLPHKRIGHDLNNRWGISGKKVRGGVISEKKTYPGLVAISNHDSFCYIAAIIQPLAQVPSFRDYFLTDMHLRELNPDNPIGKKGKFAIQFGHMVKNLWSAKYGIIKPVYFKNELVKDRRDYEGFELRDSFELMVFLMDGIHEDCNRIKNKPYVKVPASDGKPDKEVADLAWKAFKARNDSVVVDLFYGQTKSCIQCPTCDHKSVTFEPALSHSLPLPVEDLTMRKMCFRYLDQSKPMLLFKIPINEDESLEEVRQKIAAQIKYEPVERLHIGRTKENRLYESYEDMSGAVRKLLGREGHLPICVLEMPVPPEDENLIDIRIDMTTPNIDAKKASTNWMWGETARFFIPFFVRVKKNSTYDQVYEAIKEALGDRIKIPPRTAKWWVWREPEDDEEEAQIKKTYGTYPLNRYIKTDLTNKDNRWEKNGKHYFFRIYERNYFEEGLPNNNEAQKVFKEGKPLTLEFHPLYARKYLVDKIFQTPHVEEFTSWKRIDPPRPTKSIYECLDVFHKPEYLIGRNSWYCSKCKDQRDGVKTFGFWKLPNYLIFHFKRFLFNPGTFDGTKIKSMLTFPEFGLDMDPYIINPDHVKGTAMYDLTGVTNHGGRSLMLGYFDNFVKYIDDQYWYYINDDKVALADPKHLQSRATYILFYKRRGFKELEFMEPEGGATEPEYPAPEEKEEKPRMPSDFLRTYMDMPSFGSMTEAGYGPMEMDGAIPSQSFAMDKYFRRKRQIEKTKESLKSTDKSTMKVPIDKYHPEMYSDDDDSS